MKFRFIDLEEFLEVKKINWKKIVEVLNKKSFETSLFKDHLEVEILPNRFSDAGNIRGLAKEISVISNFKFKDIKFKLREKRQKYPFKVIVQTENCSHYFGRIILNIKNKKSPLWLVNFLKFYNLKPINYLVDLSNYVMIKIGAPLHIFDLDKIKNKSIIIRQAKNKEKFFSLKNKEFILDSEDIVIADSEKILALAGIQGSNLASVDLKTKNVFIEAAVFESRLIYKTSRKLNLITEASYRFERNVIPLNSFFSLNYLTYLIERELKGEVIKEIYSFGKEKLDFSKKINLDINKVKNYIGTEIKTSEILNLLKKLNFKIINQSKNYLTLLTPPERKDLNLDVDIIEEIIRIWGYDKILSFNSFSFNFPQEDKLLAIKDKLRNFLIQLGLTEIISYNFIDNQDLQILENIFNFKPLEIINPTSSLFKFYRPFIFPNLLKAISKNLALYNWLETRDFQLFEIGKIAFYENKNLNINESTNISLIFTSSQLKEIFLTAKGIISKIFEFSNIKNFSFEPLKKNNNFELILSLLVNKKQIGFLLVPSSSLLDFYNIKQKTVIVEIFLSKLLPYMQLEKKFTPILKFPAIFRDLSFAIPAYLPYKEIEKEIKNISKNLLEKIELFDVYYLNNQKKSVSFHLVFRKKNTTLKDEEVNELIEKIVTILKNKFNISLR